MLMLYFSDLYTKFVDNFTLKNFREIENNKIKQHHFYWSTRYTGSYYNATFDA